MKEIKVIAIGLTGIALFGGGCYLAGELAGYEKGWNDCGDMVRERLSVARERLEKLRGSFEELKKRVYGEDGVRR